MVGLTTQQMQLVEQRVANDGPSTGVAYLLWFFTWWCSGHRFYLGRPGLALLQIASYFVLVGFIWVLVDAFLIPGMIRERKDRIRKDVTLQLLAAGNTDQPPPAAAVPATA